MTEKRFNVFDVDGTIFLEDHKKGSYHIGEIGNVDVNCLNDIAYRLNELAEENKELKEGVEEFNEICKYYEMRIKELSEQADAVRTELHLCEEENNELQARNDRQAETIRKLYTLIGNKDWKALTTYMEELDRYEEQLRKEWRIYND